MRSYLQEKLEWRLSKEKCRSAVADKFLERRGPRRLEDRHSVQRAYAGSSGQNVQFENRGKRGRTQCPGCQQASERCGVFQIVEEEGTTGDERGCGPEVTDTGKQAGRPGKE